MQASPNQLANLKSWRPGESANPGGRPKGVVYPVEYLRSMGGMTQQELESIRDDPSQPVNRRAAAGMAMQMVDAGVSPKDRREAFGEVADRTSGRPTQSVDVRATATSSPTQLLDELRRKHALPKYEPLMLAKPEGGEHDNGDG